MIEGYTTVKATAEKWGITPRTVQILCAEGKIAVSYTHLLKVILVMISVSKS